jgi:hypothetical protein
MCTQSERLRLVWNVSGQPTYDSRYRSSRQELRVQPTTIIKRDQSLPCSANTQSLVTEAGVGIDVRE